MDKFITINEMYVPVSNDFSDNVYITNSMDPSSHFETLTENVISMYKKITGKDLDLENIPEDKEDQ